MERMIRGPCCANHVDEFLEIFWHNSSLYNVDPKSPDLWYFLEILADCSYKPVETRGRAVPRKIKE